MTNDISAIMPKILARGLMTLREQAIMPRLVNGSYSADAAEKGDTVDVPLPADLVAENVTPGATAPATDDVAAGKVQIVLNNWKKASFHLTDKEMMEISAQENFIPMQVGSAIRALANAVNQSIHAQYTGIYGLVGTAGTTPFASDSTDATLSRKLLHKQLAPRENRYGVLNFDAESNALDLAAFADADKSGDAAVKIEGEIGRKFGINWYSDDHVMTHTTGASGTPEVAATDTTGNILQVSGLSTDPNVGDVFTISNDDQQYTVLEVAPSGSDRKLTVAPELPAVMVGDDLTFTGDHVVNLVFNRDAFAFANRPLAQSGIGSGLGNQIMTMTDPQTGLSLRLEVSRQYKQVVWEFDILWGVKLIRPELAVRLAG